MIVNIVVVLCPDCALEFRIAGIAEILCEADDGGMAYLQFFSQFSRGHKAYFPEIVENIISNLAFLFR